MKVLLPYLIGAASTFLVQFLIQFYIVPRVQTRKHLEERWVKDVLDLGELLTTSVDQLAKEAWQAQQSVRMFKDLSFGPEYDPAKVERELRERKLAEQQATWAHRDLVNSRVNWVADRIIMLSDNTDEIFDLFHASYKYRVKLLQFGPSEYLDLAEDEFDDFWAAERELRFQLTQVVKKLSYLPRPPRKPWRGRLRSLKRKILRRRTVRPAVPTPVQAAASPSPPPSSS